MVMAGIGWTLSRLRTNIIHLQILMVMIMEMRIQFTYLEKWIWVGLWLLELIIHVRLES